MAPPARKSQRTMHDVRKDVALSPVDEDSSPSRPAKRRKKLDDSPASPTPPDDTINHDELLTRITQQLQTGEPTQASKDHANSIYEANAHGIDAYAKLAAMDWTYYIKKLAINIGRSPEGAAAADARDDEDEDHIHIDLGPGKVVSRHHAVIFYDSKEESWLLRVNGRNGVKVNGALVKAVHGPHALTSGEVLDIGNVEMMFVLPAEISPLRVHPKYYERCGLSAEASEEQPPKRQPLVSSASSDYKRPGTPPPSAQSRLASAIGKSPAVSTPGLVMVGADGVDLTLDKNKEVKPQFSYAQMITQAILNAADGKLNLSGIYDYIMKAYSYYRHQNVAGWQNSIRHNLSLNKAFEKVPRTTDEPGKGMKWQIVPEAKEEMVRNAFRIGRGGHRGSSAPSSPSQLNYITHGPKDMASRGSPSVRKRRSSLLGSPPGSRPIPQSTPDRPPPRASGRSATLTADGSPLPRPKRLAVPAVSLSSFAPQSPTLTSSYYEGDGAFVTPAPPRVHPRLAPPSTAQRPSQMMPTSSPAPFWKYADIGSTPIRPPGYEMSPSKPSTLGLPPPSSSPPRAPLRGNRSPPSSPTRGLQRGSSQNQAEPPEQEEEEGYDLTKGFQSIGSYHAPQSKGIPVTNYLGGR